MPSSSEFEFLQACKSGDVERARRLVRIHAVVLSNVHTYGSSAATLHENIDMLKFLYEDHGLALPTLMRSASESFETAYHYELPEPAKFLLGSSYLDLGLERITWNEYLRRVYYPAPNEDSEELQEINQYIWKSQVLGSSFFRRCCRLLGAEMTWDRVEDLQHFESFTDEEIQTAFHPSKKHHSLRI